MPINREPRIYQGYVISQIGQSAGKRVDMEFKVAQSCVSSGTHRWADDETDLPSHVQARVNEAEVARQRQIENDALHFKGLQEGEQRDPADVEAMAARARPLRVSVTASEGNPEARHYFLAAPLPPVLAVDFGVLETIKPEVDINDVGEIVITFENAKARYQVVSRDDDIYIAELVESDQPNVDIPDDWRDLHHLTLIPLAKTIRRTKDSMTKDEAVAVIEEWVKSDDQVSEFEGDGASQQGANAGTDGGTDEADKFKGTDGTPISAEERARQAAQDFDDGVDF